jgi:hypothetical protein
VKDTVTKIVHAALRSYGYLHGWQVQVLAREEEFRLCPVLARFSCCRFTAPAQDIEFLLDRVEGEQKQRYVYLRDLYIREEELKARLERYIDRRVSSATTEHYGV